MNLQKKLIQLSEYKCSFKYVESYFLVSMSYPETWSVIPSEDRTIEVAEEDGVTFYAAPIETDIEKAFELIDDTIAYNLDVEKKMNLLKFNINKLQEMFVTMDLERLETLEFVTRDPTPKQLAEKKPRQRKTTIKRTIKKKSTTKTVSGDDMTNDTQVDKSVQSTDECMVHDNDMGICAGVELVSAENKFLEEVER